MDVSIKGEIIKMQEVDLFHAELIKEIIKEAFYDKKGPLKIVIAITKEGKRFCIIE